MRKPSRHVATVVVVALAGAGGTTWWLTRPEPAAAQAATMTVSRETFKDTVSASGTIEPKRQADLSFTVTGTVTAVRVREGQRVRKGDVLAVVDDDLLQSDVDAKASALDAARTRLDDDQDADASDTQLASDQAAVVDAESQLAQAEEALSNARLRSTITGTVASVDVAVGDTVGGTQAQQGEPADVTVVSAQRFLVEAQVATADIDRVKKGLQVEITPTGATEPVYGTVRSVGRVAEAQENGAATFPVTVEVTGRRKDVFAGVAATLQIVVRQVDDVLAVPSMALRQGDDGTFVYRLVDGRRVRTPVETGETFGVSTEVVSGLAEGDEVEVVSFARTPGGNAPGGGNVQLPPGGMVFGEGGGPGVRIETAP